MYILNSYDMLDLNDRANRSCFQEDNEMGEDTFEELFGEPVDIGKWFPYNAYVNKEQTSIQRDNLISTGLYSINASNDIKFVPTKLIKMYNEDITNMQKMIKITDTEVVLEHEVFYTAKIEGAKTTLIRTHELNKGSKIRVDNRNSELMVLNGFKAVKYMNLVGNRMDRNILIEVWNILIDGCCENEKIRGDGYRTGNVYVGNHEGLNYELVEEYMEKLICFYNSDKYDSVPFMKAILMHYAFETIHPFCDGNGRLGRLLINNYLISRGLDCCRAVSFSKLISERRSGYDAAFVDSENIYNDCTPFLEYMLSIFDDSLHSVIESQTR